MEKLIHTIEARSCPEVWTRALELLLDREQHNAYNLVLGVHEPEKLSAEDYRAFEEADGFLRQFDRPPLTTVANTIFPAGFYLQNGAKGVFEDYPEVYPQLKTGWGTYAHRMLRKPLPSKGDEQEYMHPLEVLVNKLKKQLTGGHFKAIYELSLVESEDFLELPTYDAAADCNRTRMHPCLSHLSFKLIPGNSIMLTAIYRYHYYVEKALGNLFGLAQLLSFVAKEAGLQVGPLVCHSTYAVLDLDGGWALSDLQKLSERCAVFYAPQPVS